MNGKMARMVRKSANKLVIDKQNMAEDLIREILNAPLWQRVKFAFGVIFKRGV